MSLSLSQILALLLCWLAYAAPHSLLASLSLKRAVAARCCGWRRPTGWRSTCSRWSCWCRRCGSLSPGAARCCGRGRRLGLVANGWRWLPWAASCGRRATTTWRCSPAAQWATRNGAAEDPGGLRLSPLHRHVRHPWYSLGLLIPVDVDMDEARLVSARCITLYLWLGSLLEERKLLALHGEAYARYRERVPGLVPWPGRSLSADEARALCASPRRAV